MPFLGLTSHWSLTDILILAGVAGYLLDRLLDSKGWAPSAKTLRRENGDLVRRNGELEATVTRLGERLDEQAKELRELRAQVVELKARDQAAVLASLAQHEVAAERRHSEHVNQQAASTSVLVEIRELLTKVGAPS